MAVLNNKIPPPLVAVIVATLMWGISLITPVHVYSSRLFLFAIALFWLIGALLLSMAALAFRRANTTVNPLKPDTASAMVTSGVYSLTRNPMYLGFVCFLCAWAIYLGSFWSLFIVVLYMIYIHVFQIKPEERALEALFGQDFIAYKSRVRAWL